MNNNQQDPRWASIILGFGTVTIGTDGCFICCIADALNTTPDIVNQVMKDAQAFQGALVDWTKLAVAFPGIQVTVKTTYDNQDVLNQLAAGNKVLVVVSAAPIGGSGIHCLEYIGNEQCKDPFTGTIRPTSDFPDLTGEYIVISGAWTQQISAAPATQGPDLSNPSLAQQFKMTVAKSTNFDVVAKAFGLTNDQAVQNDAGQTIVTIYQKLQGDLKDAQWASEDYKNKLTALQLSQQTPQTAQNGAQTPSPAVSSAIPPSVPSSPQDASSGNTAAVPSFQNGKPAVAGIQTPPVATTANASPRLTPQAALSGFYSHLKAVLRVLFW